MRRLKEYFSRNVPSVRYRTARLAAQDYSPTLDAARDETGPGGNTFHRHIKGITVKALWICGLLFLLSLVALGRISVAVSGTGDPQSETQAAPFIDALPPSLDEYVFLHATRNAGVAL